MTVQRPLDGERTEFCYRQQMYGVSVLLYCLFLIISDYSKFISSSAHSVRALSSRLRVFG